MKDFIVMVISVLRLGRSQLGNCFFIVLVLLFISISGAGQDSYPDDYFQSPLDIPLYLAGNFAEMRSNHFHSGLDFKTQGREGLKIYAVADGYVSRIKVSPFGYGQALYIDHPNGTTSVYAHLQSYNDSITTFLRNAQYDLESFEVDLYPEPNHLRVSQGEVVGLSGNTGSSGGPHLHFEIRQTETEYPINPLLYGFEVKDNVKPEILNLMVLPLNGNYRQNQDGRKTYSTANTRGKCRLKCTDPILVEGKFGLALHTLDRLNDQPNKCGVFDIKLLIDSQLVYHQQMEKLDFSTRKHMNAHTVYDVYKQERKSFHRSFSLAQNKLDIYELKTDGFELEDGLHNCEYIVEDVHGNISTLTFQLKSTASRTTANKPEGDVWFSYDTVNTIRRDNCTLFLPEGRLFEDMVFSLGEVHPGDSSRHAEFVVGDRWIPIANDYILKIRAEYLDSALHDKAFVAWQGKKGGRLVNQGGKHRHGWIECRPDRFGRFSLTVDTLAPSIKSLDFRSNMQGYRNFSFKITDDLSGIETFRGEIDGHWILMEYEPKRNKLTYHFDSERLAKGDHHFALEVTDERGNTREFESDFVW